MHPNERGRDVRPALYAEQDQTKKRPNQDKNRMRQNKKKQKLVETS